MTQMSLMRRIFGNARPGERRRRPRAGAACGLQMLVVDDSATIRAVLGKMLVQNGYDVLSAGNGETGMDLAREYVPDLVFLDIVMPGMSGFAVLRALRRDVRTRTIPVVMISGNPQATEQFYVQRFGADDFMKKPFGRNDVFARIARLTSTGQLAVGKRIPRAQPMIAPRLESRTASPEMATAQLLGALEPTERNG